MSQAADFFVSYTSADRAWAEWIAWQLEAEGYQVVVQAWDFTAGRDWAHEMQQATATAERVVLVLSAAYLRSAHGEAEWRAFYAKDPSGERELLLPVRISQVEPPGLLTTRIYVDLVDQDTPGARRALLAAARGARGKPTEAPEFPGGRRSQVSATEAPRFPGELPPVWSVPFHPNPFFTGRDLVLAELQTRLQAPDTATRRVVLTGLGGIGKTSVAVEYVYRRHADYDLVWCVNGEQPASLLADLAALAGQLGLAADAPQETQVASLRAWLERHQRWLLVLDNVDDPQQVVDLLPRSATGQVVVTSRTGVGWERLASVLPIDVLAPADAAGLLLTREQPLGYQHTVATTWSLALQRLQQAEPAAVDLLTLASFVAPDDLPLPLVAAHHDQLPEPLTTAAGDPLALADAVAALRRYSLIRVVADGLYVHRLLQTVVRTVLDDDAKRAWAATAVRLLRAGWPSESDSVAAWPDCQRLLPHVLAVGDHGQRLDVELVEWLWVLHQAAVYLWSRGQYRQALTLQEQALAGLRSMLGDDHPDTLHSMNDLAETRRDLGDLQGARQLFEETLTARQRVLGDDHPDTLWSMHDLAATRRNLGDLEGARQLFEQTLTARRRVLGDDHPDTLTSKKNVAELQQRLKGP
jgi:tetratricopeptide (TPR) repeat protein